MNRKRKLHSSNEEKVSFFYYFWIVSRIKIRKITKKVTDFRKRRPHKSFRLTKRRDYRRSLKLPGYIKFTKYVFVIIFKNKKIFLSLTFLISILGIIFIGLMDQEFINNLRGTLDETSGDLLSGGFGEVGKVGILLFSTISSGGLTISPNEGQQLALTLIMIFSWLTVVWILRGILNGEKVSLKKALYNCGSPIISTIIVVLAIFIQFIPALLVIIAYSSAVNTQFLSGGVETMVFCAVAILLASLSIYWFVGSFFSLIIVTLPGMFPLKAFKLAGDMVVGRRLKILSRLTWSLLISAIMWLIAMIPVAILTNWLNSSFEWIGSIPVMPFAMFFTSVIAILFTYSYAYLFYREVIKDDSTPA